MHKRILFSLIFFMLFPVCIKAQVLEFTENCKQASRFVLELNFEQATELIEKEKHTYPQNQYPVFLENYIDFLKIIIGEEEKDFESFLEKKRERINQLKAANSNSPHYQYCLANVYMQFAFARMKFKQYLSAAFEIKKAYNLIEKNLKEFPDFVHHHIAAGVLHSLIGSVPDKYKWVANLISMHGTINQGFDEMLFVLHKATTDVQYEYLTVETIFFLTFMELNLNPNTNHIPDLLKIINTLPENNSLLAYAKVSILMKTGHNDQAIKVLEQHKPSEKTYPFHYLNYLLGLAKLHRLDADADTYFHEYLKKFKGNSYVKSAYQKIAWANLARGNTDKYREYILRISDVGNTIIDGDMQAQNEAESKQLPNIHLLKARLLFDGGYYENAISTLQDEDAIKSIHTRKDSVEYKYRLGRIYHLSKNEEKAIANYKSAIELGQKLPQYYAGNAALQLGYIYENKKQLKMAEYYYNLCINLKFEEYKTSISQKAKAGLNRIGQT